LNNWEKKGQRKIRGQTGKRILATQNDMLAGSSKKWNEMDEQSQGKMPMRAEGKKRPKLIQEGQNRAYHIRV